MLKLKADIRLDASRDALMASATTFVLAAFFFVMAFVIYPAVF